MLVFEEFIEVVGLNLYLGCYNFEIPHKCQNIFVLRLRDSRHKSERDNVATFVLLTEMMKQVHCFQEFAECLCFKLFELHHEI